MLVLKCWCKYISPIFNFKDGFDYLVNWIYLIFLGEKKNEENRLSNIRWQIFGCKLLLLIRIGSIIMSVTNEDRIFVILDTGKLYHSVAILPIQIAVLQQYYYWNVLKKISYSWFSWFSCVGKINQIYTSHNWDSNESVSDQRKL